MNNKTGMGEIREQLWLAVVINWEQLEVINRFEDAQERVKKRQNQLHGQNKRLRNERKPSGAKVKTGSRANRIRMNPAMASSATTTHTSMMSVGCLGKIQDRWRQEMR